MKRISILIALIISIAAPALAQRVEAGFDTFAIRIGEQTGLTISATAKPGDKLTFPAFYDTIPGGLELIENLGLDTIATDNGQLTISARYLVTGWDSALVYIDSLPVIAGQDTLYANPISLKVIEIEVDTANAICDIKPVYKPPFDWRLLWTIVIITLLAAALIVLGIWLYLKYFKNRKKQAEEEAKFVDMRPAHIIAMERLEELRRHNLWQEGKFKEYYSVLTDILKSYVGRRYNISAIEQTSDDLLRELRMNTSIEIDKQAVETLSEILHLADLVKFAKWNPLPADNEKAFEDGRTFVQQTKLEEKKDEVR